MKFSFVVQHYFIIILLKYYLTILNIILLFLYLFLQQPYTWKGIVDGAGTRRCCWVEWETADTEQASQYQRQYWLLQTAPKLAITHVGQCTKEYQGCKFTTNNRYSNFTSALYKYVSKTGTPESSFNFTKQNPL